MLKQRILNFSLALALVNTSLILITSSPTISAELAEIERRGKLIVAVKDNLPPLGFTDSEGNLQGLEIDIARHLAQELLGSSEAIIFQPVTNQERLDLLLQGKVDLIIARMTATVPRSRLVDFSRYYYLDGTGLITKDTSLQNLKDITTQTVAVLNNSQTIAVVRNALPQAQLIGVDSYQEALSLLEAGTAIAFAADKSILTGWVQEYPQYRQLPERISGEALSIAMPKGLQYLDLQQQVNKAITTWQQSGWLQERLIYWGLPQ